MGTFKASRFGGGIAAALLLIQLLTACGGGQQAAQAPVQGLSLRLQGPAQVHAGDRAHLTGVIDAGSEIPASLRWTLLERPAGSRATLDDSGSSANQLRTDVAGRYVVQWSGTAADGRQESLRWVVHAVDGPLVQSGSGLDVLRVGQTDVLSASLPAAQEGEEVSYQWRLLQAPAGSRATLSGTWGKEVALAADAPGEYSVEVEARHGNAVTRSVSRLRALSSRPSGGSFLAVPAVTCPPITRSCHQYLGVPARLSTYLVQPVGDARVQYHWKVLSTPAGSQLGNATGEGMEFSLVPDMLGIYLVQLSPTSPDINIAGGLAYLLVEPKPVGSIKVPPLVKVNELVELDSSMNRNEDGTPITYQHCWKISKAPVGSSAKVQPECQWTDKAQLRPDRGGEYVVSLSVGPITDYATIAFRAQAADPQRIYPAQVTGDLSAHLPGEAFELKAETMSESGNPVAYEWRWGDGAVSTGAEASHSYAFPADYPVHVIATDTITGRTARQLVVAKVTAQRLDNIPPVPCSTPPCPAASPSSYGGQGLGHWRLNNDGALSTSVNLDIAGVTEGRQVLVSLSNASPEASGPVELGVATGADPIPYFPLENAGPSTASDRPRTGTFSRRDDAHAARLERERALMKSLSGPASKAQTGARRRTALGAAPRQVPPLLELGTQRDWAEAGSATTVYSSRLTAICSLPNGRPVYFWLDDMASTSGLLSPDQLAADFVPLGCGEPGLFHRVQKLLDAEVFGPHENARLIGDTPMQPLHIAFVDPRDDVGWGAYVSFGNLVLKSEYRGSNEALLMVVNARLVKVDLNFLKSALAHEFMHLVNFYQRTVLNGLDMHESWLEETTAMMAEDLVSSNAIANPDGSPFAPMSLRLNSYQGIAYAREYFFGEYPDYSVGGSLAAYLDRRLGAKLLRRLTFECRSSGLAPEGYRCLDDQVFALSGRGVAASFAALNATLVGGVNQATSPDLGLPAYVSDEVNLPAIDLKKLQWRPPASTYRPWNMRAGGHIYQWDVVNDRAEGRYRRKGILVPPGHVLQVLIR